MADNHVPQSPSPAGEDERGLSGSRDPAGNTLRSRGDRQQFTVSSTAGDKTHLPKPAATATGKGSDHDDHNDHNGHNDGGDGPRHKTARSPRTGTATASPPSTPFESAHEPSTPEDKTQLLARQLLNACSAFGAVLPNQGLDLLSSRNPIGYLNSQVMALSEQDPYMASIVRGILSNA